MDLIFPCFSLLFRRISVSGCWAPPTRLESPQLTSVSRRLRSLSAGGRWWQGRLAPRGTQPACTQEDRGTTEASSSIWLEDLQCIEDSVQWSWKTTGRYKISSSELCDVSTWIITFSSCFVVYEWIPQYPGLLLAEKLALWDRLHHSTCRGVCCDACTRIWKRCEGASAGPICSCGIQGLRYDSFDCGVESGSWGFWSAGCCLRTCVWFGSLGVLCSCLWLCWSSSFCPGVGLLSCLAIKYATNRAWRYDTSSAEISWEVAGGLHHCISTRSRSTFRSLAEDVSRGYRWYRCRVGRLRLCF